MNNEKMRFATPLILIILIVLCVSCGPTDSKTTTDSRRSQLQELFDVKIKQLTSVSDQVSGWPSTHDCDGVLWAGLACYAGLPVNIDLAEYSPGLIGRRPAPNCSVPDESSSTISRDQLTGYMACRWARRDTASLLRLAEYGANNNWIMGTPSLKIDLVWFGENLQGLLGRMLDKDYGKKPLLWFPLDRDYQRHIDSIQAILQADVGRLDFLALDRLKKNVESNGQDATFQAALGRYSGDLGPAVELLLSPDYKTPSYVRGHENYPLVHWVFTASVVLNSLYEGDEHARN